MKRRALWVAPDSRKFTVEFTTREELMDKIADLREQHGYPQPEAIHAMALRPDADLLLKGKGVIDSADLPEGVEEKLVKDSLALVSKPDPKTLN